MSASQPANDQRPASLGYFTYVDLPLLGTVGGLLVVDLRARPIEFHCSSPVLPTRTQEILYGQTLRQTVICDQIGQSLITQVKQQPQLLVTDELLALELQDQIQTPMVAFVDSHDEVDWNHSSVRELQFGTCRAHIANDTRFNPNQIESIWNARVGNWDGLEPLERIREAISEAHRAAA